MATVFISFYSFKNSIKTSVPQISVAFCAAVVKSRSIKLIAMLKKDSYRLVPIIL